MMIEENKLKKKQGLADQKKKEVIRLANEKNAKLKISVKDQCHRKPAFGGPVKDSNEENSNQVSLFYVWDAGTPLSQDLLSNLRERREQNSRIGSDSKVPVEPNLEELKIEDHGEDRSKAKWLKNYCCFFEVVKHI